MSERDVIVAWIRNGAQFDDSLGHAKLMRHLAACIEDGDHLSEQATEDHHPEAELLVLTNVHLTDPNYKHEQVGRIRLVLELDQEAMKEWACEGPIIEEMLNSVHHLAAGMIDGLNNPHSSIWLVRPEKEGK